MEPTHAAQADFDPDFASDFDTEEHDDIFVAAEDDEDDLAAFDIPSAAVRELSDLEDIEETARNFPRKMTNAVIPVRLQAGTFAFLVSKLVNNTLGERANPIPTSHFGPGKERLMLSAINTLTSAYSAHLCALVRREDGFDDIILRIANTKWIEKNIGTPVFLDRNGDVIGKKALTTAGTELQGTSRAWDRMKKNPGVFENPKENNMAPAGKGEFYQEDIRNALDETLRITNKIIETGSTSRTGLRVSSNRLQHHFGKVAEVGPIPDLEPKKAQEILDILTSFTAKQMGEYFMFSKFSLGSTLERVRTHLALSGKKIDTVITEQDPLGYFIPRALLEKKLGKDLRKLPEELIKARPYREIKDLKQYAKQDTRIDVFNRAAQGPAQDDDRVYVSMYFLVALARTAALSTALAVEPDVEAPKALPSAP